ncbi:ATP-dependent RNA helicase TDRD9 [Trichonephila clavipes]|nr:ATP-dependent RNA helicase TDRD9 [Trichonephila clavipes]
MTTSNQITLDHINAFFSLDADIQPLNVAPTATGGAGIIHSVEESSPVTSVPHWRERRTEYVKRVLDKDKELEVLDESRSFFRVHTSYFSNIPKCIKAEFIASWACSQSSVVSSSKR